VCVCAKRQASKRASERARERESARAKRVASVNMCVCYVEYVCMLQGQVRERVVVFECEQV